MSFDSNIAAWSAVQILRRTPSFLKWALKWAVNPNRALARLCLKPDGQIVIVNSVLTLPLEWSYNYAADFQFEPAVVHLIHENFSTDAIPRLKSIVFRAYERGRLSLEADVKMNQTNNWNLRPGTTLIAARIEFVGELRGNFFSGPYPFPDLKSVAIYVSI